MFINPIIQIILRDLPFTNITHVVIIPVFFFVCIAEKQDTAASVSFTLLCSSMVQVCSENGWLEVFCSGKEGESFCCWKMCDNVWLSTQSRVIAQLLPPYRHTHWIVLSHSATRSSFLLSDTFCHFTVLSFVNWSHEWGSGEPTNTVMKLKHTNTKASVCTWRQPLMMQRQADTWWSAGSS